MVNVAELASLEKSVVPVPAWFPAPPVKPTVVVLVSMSKPTELTVVLATKRVLPVRFVPVVDVSFLARAD